MSKRLTHRERVNIALSHNSSDQIPVDFAAEPEIWQRLQRRLRLNSREDILRYLDVDCRVVSYDYEAFCHPPDNCRASGKSAYTTWMRKLSDGTMVDVWGARRKIVHNKFGSYKELCNYPLADAQKIGDLREYKWPTPDWWDFSQLSTAIEEINENGEYHLRYRIGSIWETAWTLRGFEQFLMDIAIQPELPCYIMDRILEIHIENLRRVMKIATDKIDMIYTYDDVAHQSGLMMSKEMWEKTLAKRQRVLFDKAKSYGKPLMYHSCGSIRPLISELIDMGMDVLNPVQPKAADMNFEELKQNFGSRISFHGGIDIQEILPKATPQEVVREALNAKNILGQEGGYILAPAHHIQADTPLENIFTLYDVSCHD